jgi:MFS family permease
MSPADEYLRGLVSRSAGLDDASAEAIKGELRSRCGYTEAQAEIVRRIVSHDLARSLGGVRRGPLSPLLHEEIVRKLVEKAGLSLPDIQWAVHEFIRALGLQPSPRTQQTAGDQPFPVELRAELSRRRACYLFSIVLLIGSACTAPLGVIGAEAIRHPLQPSIARELVADLRTDWKEKHFWSLAMSPPICGLLGTVFGAMVVLAFVSAEPKFVTRSLSTAVLLAQAAAGGFAGAMAGYLLDASSYVNASAAVFVMAALGAGGIVAGLFAVAGQLLALFGAGLMFLLAAIVIGLIALIRWTAPNAVVSEKTFFDTIEQTHHFLALVLVPSLMIATAWTAAYFGMATPDALRGGRDRGLPLPGHLFLHAINFILAMSVLYGVYVLWQRFYSDRVFVNFPHSDSAMDVCFVGERTQNLMSGGLDRRVVVHRVDRGRWGEPELRKEGYDLRLMSSVKDVSAIPTAGKRLVIVAYVDHVLRFRIFDSDGKMAVDTDATQRTTQTPQVEDLSKQLEQLVAAP